MSESKPKMGRPPGSKNKTDHSAGRPTLGDGEPSERYTVTMPASWWRYVEALGEGNRGAGVRLAVEWVMPLVK